MADALVEHSGRAGPVRFFCHRCNVEFEDTLQEYICPYCSGGFIEELAGDVGETTGAGRPGGSDGLDTDSMDTDASDNIDDDTDGQPFVNDLTFLMSGGRLRGMLGGAETLLQHLVFALAGGTDARAPGTGAPFVFVGAPGDYVLGGEGLDAVVTQLLGQLEGSGPPPLPGDQMDLIHSVAITQEQVDARLQCSVCWDHFVLDESVSQLACLHVFHAQCIRPWLQLHATCPICRHSLLPEQDSQESLAASSDLSLPSRAQSPPVFLQRNGRSVHRRLSASLADSPRHPLRLPRSTSPSTSSASTSSVASWGPPPPRAASASASSSSDPSEPSRHSSQYNMDLDFD